MNSNRKTKWILICAFMATCILLVVGGNAEADFLFGPAQNAGPLINTSQSEIEPSLDSLYMWFARYNGSAWQWWRISRVTEDAPWENPVNFGTWKDSYWNFVAVMWTYTTADGLELYFYSSETERPEGYGGYDIWMLKRENINDDWGPAINLGPIVNSEYDDAMPAVSPDGLELYFSGWHDDARPGGYGKADLWVTRRITRDDPWSEPENLGPTINTSSSDARPMLAADGLLLFFESDRPGGFGSADLYMMKRDSVYDSWSEPINLGPTVNSSSSDENGVLSPDGTTLYFHSNRPGGYGSYDIWLASVSPIVDFDSNGMCDINDLVIMIENWDTNEPSCDIGPTAWGDGIVDRADLEVLMEYWNEVVDVAAYYKLDETEGAVAYDCSGYYCDANVIGDPNWLPDDGMINGSIELDGINDYISTPFILNPNAALSFSVFAWIKGGLPGEVILSQVNSVSWLAANPNGCLMTELKGGRGACDLISEVVITDGNWHRVGFTWDGTYRILYVDEVIAAIDTQGALPSSEGGLYIGAGKGLEPETFWTGLIDDVRIYDQVIIP